MRGRGDSKANDEEINRGRKGSTGGNERTDENEISEGREGMKRGKEAGDSKRR